MYHCLEQQSLCLHPMGHKIPPGKVCLPPWPFPMQAKRKPKLQFWGSLEKNKKKKKKRFLPLTIKEKNSPIVKASGLQLVPFSPHSPDQLFLSTMRFKKPFFSMTRIGFVHSQLTHSLSFQMTWLVGHGECRGRKGRHKALCFYIPF